MSGSGPAVASSKRKVVYRRSGWAVHEFSVWAGGALVCRAAALRMRGSLLLWLGGAPPALGALALGLPGGAASGEGGEGGADAAALARRLAAALRRPVWVAAALPLDRFSAPLVTRGLVAEIKSRSDFFDDPDAVEPDRLCELSND
ncbi:uncharacterized protein [Choristoneura fumiferana]|uniref:uncharacterized protein n=1 Tax=Choristoneura fumiferana TaxID=7141 RepID=UPI003D15D0E3